MFIVGWNPTGKCLAKKKKFFPKETKTKKTFRILRRRKISRKRFSLSLITHFNIHLIMFPLPPLPYPLYLYYLKRVLPVLISSVWKLWQSDPLLECTRLRKALIYAVLRVSCRTMISYLRQHCTGKRKHNNESIIEDDDKTTEIDNNADAKKKKKSSSLDSPIESNESKLEVNENESNAAHPDDDLNEASDEISNKGIENQNAFTILKNACMNDKKKVKRKLPDWLSNPSVVSVDLKNLNYTIDSISGLDKIFIDKLRANGITHFFPGLFSHRKFICIKIGFPSLKSNLSTL